MKNFLLTIILLLISIGCFAATKTWIGDDDDDWNNPLNWNGNNLPNDNDDIIIDADNYAGNNAPIISSDSDFDPDVITIRDGGILTVTGGNLDIDEDIEIEDGSSYIQSGGTVDLGGELIVGINGDLNAGGNTINISGGSFETGNGNDVEIYSNNNTFNFSGTANVNVQENFDFHDTEENRINVSGNAVLDVDDDIEFGGTTDNLFSISGNSRVTVGDGSAGSGTDQDDATAANQFFTVTEGGYLKLGNLDPILPVELIEFKAEIKENTVGLNWSTASEKNNDYFELLKSEDGITFSSIGKIPGNGTSNSVNHYDYVDQHPKYGINYYQLRQVDYDGKNESFPVILVIYGSSRELVSHMVVWPNPVTESRFNITIDNYQITGIPTISLIDLQGRVLLKESFSPNSNSISIDASGTRINSGIYILEYHNGLERIRKRIVMN